MSTTPHPARTAIIPCLQYRHAESAIDWLCQTFGFERHAIYKDDSGTIVHAELTLGDAMIMVGEYENQSAFGKAMVHPDEIDQRQTQTNYVMTSAVDDVYRRAREAGVTMFLDIEEKPYGGRGFSCRDLEGYIWSFGSYDPWSK